MPPIKNVKMFKKNKTNSCLEFLYNNNLLNSKRSNSRLDFVMNKNILPKSKRSQVWVETVVYTLIGLTIIGIVLSMALPQIVA